MNEAKLLLSLTSLTLSTAAIAGDAQCELNVRNTGSVTGQTKAVKVDGHRPYWFMQEYFGEFMFQLSFDSEGPADGPPGKVKAIRLMIQKSGEFFQSSTVYPADAKEGRLSLVVPATNGGTIASMTCSNP